ncbi:MAG: hypothetical protein V7633_3863 [Pseudonocardia sp.]|jgi:hypothetical protein
MPCSSTRSGKVGSRACRRAAEKPLACVHSGHGPATCPGGPLGRRARRHAVPRRRPRPRAADGPPDPRRPDRRPPRGTDGPAGGGPGDRLLPGAAGLGRLHRGLPRDDRPLRRRHRAARRGVRRRDRQPADARLPAAQGRLRRHRPAPGARGRRAGALHQPGRDVDLLAADRHAAVTPPVRRAAARPACGAPAARPAPGRGGAAARSWLPAPHRHRPPGPSPCTPA